MKPLSNKGDEFIYVLGSIERKAALHHTYAYVRMRRLHNGVGFKDE